jgi:hypothetical protein
MINKRAVQNKDSWDKAMNRLAKCDAKEEPIIMSELSLLNAEYKKLTINGGKNEPTK